MENIDMIAEEKLPVTAASPESGTPAADPYRTRFKKGKSGNPNGRPKLTPAQKDALETILSIPLVSS